MTLFTFDLQFQGPMVGLDEVGYGPWAGPVLTAAVMVIEHHGLEDTYGKRVKDSKKLSALQRDLLFQELSMDPRIVYTLGQSSVEEIDELNIRRATEFAMERSIQDLRLKSPLIPKTFLVDGTLKPKLPGSTLTITKGDQQSFSIAAASILAKVTRDRLMQDLHTLFPQYGWQTNMGYGTAEHQAALKSYGVTPHHRRSYKPVAALL